MKKTIFNQETEDKKILIAFLKVCEKKNIKKIDVKKTLAEFLVAHKDEKRPLKPKNIESWFYYNIGVKNV